MMDVHRRHDDPECSPEAFLRYQELERHHRECKQKTCLWRLLKGGEKRAGRIREKEMEEKKRGILTKPPATVRI